MRPLILYRPKAYSTEATTLDRLVPYKCGHDRYIRIDIVIAIVGLAFVAGLAI